MKTIQLYNKGDVVKTRLGTLFIISNFHEHMENEVKNAFELKFIKYYAQRLEIKNGVKFKDDYMTTFESPEDKALIRHTKFSTLHDNFTGNFTYVGTLKDVIAANGITNSGIKNDW